MLERVKSFGWSVLGVVFILALLALVGVLIGGASWISDHLLHWFVRASGVAFAIELFILLPLSAFRKTRSFAGLMIACASFLFGATVWMAGLVTTETLWGTWAVILGLCIAGIGVVPIALVASLFHADWRLFCMLLLFVVLTFGSRAYAAWISEMQNS